MVTVPQKVIITVYCDSGHIIGEYDNGISEKYPFYCPQCDTQCTTGKYPWYITTRIVDVSDG